MESPVPALYLKQGRKLVAIRLDQCSPLMEAYKDGYGASEMAKPSIDLFDEDGKQIGEISYNGRVWLINGEERTEIPQPGQPTAKEFWERHNRESAESDGMPL